MSNPLTGHLGNGCYFNLLIRPSLGVQKTMILKVNLCTTGNWRALHPLPTLRYQSKMLQCEKPVISQSYYLPPPYSSNLLMAKNKQKVSCISGTSSRGKRSQPALTPFFFVPFFCSMFSMQNFWQCFSSSRFVACGVWHTLNWLL